MREEGVGGRGGYPGVRGGVEESKMPSGEVQVLRGSVDSSPEGMLRRAPVEGGRQILAPSKHGEGITKMRMIKRTQT